VHRAPNVQSVDGGIEVTGSLKCFEINSTDIAALIVIMAARLSEEAVVERLLAVGLKAQDVQHTYRKVVDLTEHDDVIPENREIPVFTITQDRNVFGLVNGRDQCTEEHRLEGEGKTIPHRRDHM
jgi:hypothetical protein